MADDKQTSKCLEAEPLVQKLTIDDKPQDEVQLQTSEKSPSESCSSGPSGAPAEKLLGETERSKSPQGGINGVEIISGRGSEFDKVFGGGSWMQIDKKTELQNVLPLPTASNYIKLAVEKNCKVFEYDVQFVPLVDAIFYRRKLVEQVLSHLSTTRMYDGEDCLYLSSRDIADRQEFAGVIPNTNYQVKIVITYKQKMKMQECYHFYNMLFSYIMHILDPNHSKLPVLQQLELNPGSIMAIDKVKDGLILICNDVQDTRSHNKTTAYQLLQEYKESNPENYKEVAMRNIAGTISLNAHNKKTYKIEGFAWDKTPKDKVIDHENIPTTFIEYYKSRYNIDIQDHDQPLLTSKITTTVDGVKREKLIYLVPELTLISGLTVHNDVLAAENGGSYRPLKSQTVFDLLQEYQAANPNNFKETTMKNIIGLIVVTRYDRSCHFVQDIVWDKTPNDVYMYRGNVPVTYSDYYKLAYNIDVQNKDQPLLLSRITTMTRGEPQENWMYLIPELSYITGISIRTNLEIREDPNSTGITCNQRKLALRKYLEKVRSSEKVQKVLADWGLKIADATREIKGKVIPP